MKQVYVLQDVVWNIFWNTISVWFRVLHFAFGGGCAVISKESHKCMGTASWSIQMKYTIEERRQQPGLRACGGSRYNRSVVKAHLAPFNTVDRLVCGFQYLSGLRKGFCRGERI